MHVFPKRGQRQGILAVFVAAYATKRPRTPVSCSVVALLEGVRQVPGHLPKVRGARGTADNESLKGDQQKVLCVFRDRLGVSVLLQARTLRGGARAAAGERERNRGLGWLVKGLSSKDAPEVAAFGGSQALGCFGKRPGSPPPQAR